MRECRFSRPVWSEGVSLFKANPESGSVTFQGQSGVRECRFSRSVRVRECHFSRPVWSEGVSLFKVSPSQGVSLFKASLE